jgi:predicted transcriptional regulator
MPPQIAARFTLAEAAVLSVIAAEARKHRACALTIGHIAALAGVSETTVRNAVREARALSLVHVEERRVSAWRNAPNVVTIMLREWSTWLQLRGKGGG